LTQTCHFGMTVVKELDRVLSDKVIPGTGGSFHRNLDGMVERVDSIFQSFSLML